MRMFALLLTLVHAPLLFAVGEASTRFHVYVPPNNDNVGRDVALIVTATTRDATASVTVSDTNEDGDTDDSATFSLSFGESWIRYIKDGSVNDDAGGKQDGDFFTITSDEPVTVSMSTNSDWQYDYVPAENKGMMGNSFIVWGPPTSISTRDIDVFAYENNTLVEVYDITSSSRTTSGKTSVNLSSPQVLLRTTLQQGQDLIATKSLGVDILAAGKTLWIRTSKPVTCMYGSLMNGGCRDGGGYVPSSNGSSSGELFYTYIPQDTNQTNERELHIVSFDYNNQITIEGWSAATGYVTISQKTCQPFETFDWIENGTSYELYRIRCTSGKKMTVFAATWLQSKGSSGTKDVASYVSSGDGSGAGKDFVVFVPYPGFQNSMSGPIGGSQATHLVVSAFDTRTSVRLVDAAGNGSAIDRTQSIPANEFKVFSLSLSDYGSLSSGGKTPYVRIYADNPVSVLMTNANDNWMTYCTSVLIPNPEVEMESSTSEIQKGSSLTLSLDVANISAGTLSNVGLSLVCPADFSLSSSWNWSLGSPSSNTVSNGKRKLVWSGKTLNTNSSVAQSVVASLSSSYAGNDGELLDFEFKVEGTYASQLYSAYNAIVVRYNNPNGTRVDSFSATPGNSSCEVSWTTSYENGISSWKVYAETSGTSSPASLASTLNGMGNSPTGNSYTATLTGLTNASAYYFWLQSVSSTNQTKNYGPVCATPLSTRDLTSSEVIAFEDLKGFAQNDWDHNDFTVRLAKRIRVDGNDRPLFAELTVTPLARGAAFDHAFRVETAATGAYSSRLKTYSASGALVSEVTASHTGTKEIEVFSSTRDCLSGSLSNTLFGSAFEQAGRTALLRVEFASGAANTMSSASDWEITPVLAVKNTSKSIRPYGPGALDNAQIVSGGPLSGYSIPLVRTLPDGFRWPGAGCAIWEAYDRYERFVTSGETRNKNWHSFPNNSKTLTESSPARVTRAIENDLMVATPVALDINQDGAVEFVFLSLGGELDIRDQHQESLHGFPIQLQGIYRATPALLTTAVGPAIAIASYEGRVLLVTMQGKIMAELQLPAPAHVVGALKTLKGDSQYRPALVVQTTEGKLYQLDESLQTLTGFPRDLGSVSEGFAASAHSPEPLLLDVNGDGITEVAALSAAGRFHVINRDGATLPGFPVDITSGCLSGPALAQGEEQARIFLHDGMGSLHAFGLDGQRIAGFPIETGLASHYPPLVSEDCVYVFGHKGSYAILDRSTLELRFHQLSGRQVLTQVHLDVNNSPLLVTASGEIRSLAPSGDLVVGSGSTISSTMDGTSTWSLSRELKAEEIASLEAADVPLQSQPEGLKHSKSISGGGCMLSNARSSIGFLALLLISFALRVAATVRSAGPVPTQIRWIRRSKICR